MCHNVIVEETQLNLKESPTDNLVTDVRVKFPKQVLYKVQF